MTPRQSKLLKAIIDEFIYSAEAVGSVSLANKYRLGVSPATIRNEMAELVKLGYLQKPHSSSGRIPTNMGFKFFIDRLLNDFEELEVRSTQSIKEQIHQNRFDTDSLIYEALTALSDETKNLSMALINNRVYYAGLYRLINKPDFEEIEEIRDIFKIVEDRTLLKAIFNRYKGDKKLKILVGEDTGMGSLANISVLFTPIKLHGGQSGYLSVLGPNRMNYARNIPLLEFIANSLNDAISGW